MDREGLSVKDPEAEVEKIANEARIFPSLALGILRKNRV